MRGDAEVTDAVGSRRFEGAGALVALAAGFAAAAYLGRVPWFVAGLIAVAGLALVAVRPLLGVCAALALMPLEAAGRVVASQPALTWAKVMIALAAGVFLLGVLSSRERLYPPAHGWGLLGFVATGVAGSIVGGWGIDIETAKWLAGIGASILLVALCYHLVRSRRAFDLVALAVIAGSVPVVVVGVVETLTKEAFFPNPMFQERLWAPGTTDVFRITSTFYDPNVLGRYLVFALLFTLAAMSLPGLKALRPVLLITIALQAYCVINTFSRAAVLVLVLVAGAFLGWRAIARWKGWGVPLMLTGAAVVGVAAWPLLRIVVERFDDPTAGGRTGIFAESLPVLGHSPIFGYGREHIAQAMGTQLGYPIDPHNLFVEILLSVGVVGALFLLSWALPTIGRLFRDWRQGSPYARLVLLPLAGTLIFGLSLHGLDGYELWIPFALAAPAIRLWGRTGETA